MDWRVLVVLGPIIMAGGWQHLTFISLLIVVKLSCSVIVATPPGQE